MARNDNDARFGANRRRILQAMGAAGAAGIAGCAGDDESTPTPEPSDDTGGDDGGDGGGGTDPDEEATDTRRFEGTVEVIDDYTLDITIPEPYADFEFNVGNALVVPREAGDPTAEDDGEIDLSTEPIGTGPYQFVQYDPDELWRLEKFDDYRFGVDNYPPEPNIEEITMRVITETSVHRGALEAGDIDMATTFPPEAVSEFEQDPAYTVSRRVAGGFDMFIYPMNAPDSPYQNNKVRLGTNRLINRPGIVDGVYDGIGQPAYAPISPLAGSFTSEEFQQEMADEYARYDVEQAVQLIEEGFEEEGIEAPYQGEIITNENPERVQWAQIIQEELNGTDLFELELNQFEWGTYVGRVLAEDSFEDEALICLGWSAGWTPDAYVNFLFTSSSHTPQCCNINHYENETVDELVREGQQTFELSERQDIYEELQREIVSDSPMAFTRFGEEIDVFDTTVLGDWQTYPINSGQFTGIYAGYAGQSATLLEAGAGDSGELVASISADPSNSEPTAINDTTSSMTTSLIYEGLMAVDFDGEPQPYLAREVEKTGDLTWRFTLHEGVQFHPSNEFDFDGREMVADDVKFSIERYINTSREDDVGEWLGTVDPEEDDG